ncbi:hypothetical protein [Sphingomonas cavernae]|uniref:Uncharacterized protein n=1 Tax=Sphingomonas cavernae TaxID=2320861 RepID=A0A418WRL9_9SPHN|nr:hypothetical protein [Sphingomonas cavernae]RJF93902.1 hypothetical protein D3876_06385 [Sphingomonas cavernae]
MQRRRKLQGAIALGVFPVAVIALSPGSGGGELTTSAHAAAPALPAPPANGEMGFIVTHFAPAVHQGEGDCPEGLAGTLRDNYLQTVAPAERTRLLDKANEKELTSNWQRTAFGPDGLNICSHPDKFDRPPQRTVRGKVAYGLNLDDDTGNDGANGGGNAGGCAHDNFTSPAGEAGIDNQMWRAMGCVRTWRGVDGMGGDIVRGLDQFLVSGEHTQVLLLRGVDSLTDDPDVEVIYANSEDRAIVDSRQKFIFGASYTVTGNARHRNVLRGRIAKGVLMTEPTDIRLRQTWGQGSARDIRGMRTEWDLRRGRLRLAFQPDGTLKGLVGGYQPFWNVMASASIGGIGAATTAGYDCAAMYAALRNMADGDRDPNTGQCTTISSGLEATAVPAFVNDRLPEAKVARK